MDILQTYSEIMTQLREGGRGLRRWSPTELSELRTALEQEKFLPETLCLVAHSASTERSLEEPLLKLLSSRKLSSTLLIHVLEACHKHVIQARFKEGLRLELSFLESLRPLLRHSELTVVEWALRTVEECGPQGVLLKSEVLAARPPFLGLWRAQNRTILELVTYLERKWAPHDSQTR